MTLPLLSDPALLALFAPIRLLSLDLDGVLTDGSLYYADDGSELRKFDVKDGMGLKLAQAAGLKLCLISASTAPAIAHRMKRLGIEAHLGIEDKRACLDAIAARHAIPLPAVAHMADDVNDLPVLRVVGLAIAPQDAMASVRATATYVTRAPGGRGAVREVTDLWRAAHGVTD